MPAGTAGLTLVCQPSGCASQHPFTATFLCDGQKSCLQSLKLGWRPAKHQSPTTHWGIELAKAHYSPWPHCRSASKQGLPEAVSAWLPARTVVCCLLYLCSPGCLDSAGVREGHQVCLQGSWMFIFLSLSGRNTGLSWQIRA